MAQLIGIGQVGGTGDDTKTSVFQGETGKTKKVAEFSRQKLGNFF